MSMDSWYVGAKTYEPNLAKFPTNRYYTHKDNMCNSWIARTRRIVPELHKLVRREEHVVGMIQKYEQQRKHASHFEAEQIQRDLRTLHMQFEAIHERYEGLLEKLTNIYKYIDDDNCMDRRKVSQHFKPNPRFDPDHLANEVKYLKMNEGHNYEKHDYAFSE